MDNIYINDLMKVIHSLPELKQMNRKTIFVTGANGLIGKFIIDMIMLINDTFSTEIKIVANSRSMENLNLNFSDYIGRNDFHYYIGDINQTISYENEVDYIINCASNTHPKQYAIDPVNTILTNIIGTSNVIQFAIKNDARMIFLSSVEIYGENINNIGRFKENEMGYIDCNSLRAGYNEAKRAGESLCQAYIEKYKAKIYLVRLPRIFGPTVKSDDSKAMSQFINKAVNEEDIVLKSEGNQFFSYLYVADAVSGIFKVLLSDKVGEIYNLGNVKADVKLKELANIIASYSNKEVIFDLPDEIEKKGYSKASDARLDYSKISEELNWEPMYSIEEGIHNTIDILKNKKNRKR